MLKALRRAAKERIQSPPADLFDRAGFTRVLDNLSLVSFDIGARGGAKNDLLPLARSVDLIGFEPDAAECEALNARKEAGPWKSAKFSPWALGSGRSRRRLNLYGKIGCSSLFAADQARAALFARGDYYESAAGVDVEVESLDALIAQGVLPAPDHIKIDVQGWELEVFKGARKTLSENVMGLRAEVAFYDLYNGQPLFSEIDAYLRGLGFVFMGFAESHAWRRRTKIKWPRQMKGPIPYSRGQLVHADVIYLKAPEDRGDDGEALRRRLKLALIAAAYEYIDHAAAALETSAMNAFGRQEFETDFSAALSKLSALMGQRRLYTRFFPEQ